MIILVTSSYLYLSAFSSFKTLFPPVRWWKANEQDWTIFVHFSVKKLRYALAGRKWMKINSTHFFSLEMVWFMNILTKKGGFSYFSALYWRNTESKVTRLDNFCAFVSGKASLRVGGRKINENKQHSVFFLLKWLDSWMFWQKRRVFMFLCFVFA